MPGKPWPDGKLWALLRAAELYQNQWRVIVVVEPICEGRAYDAVRIRGGTLLRDRWQPPEGTDRIDLLIETDPDKVRAIIETMPGVALPDTLHRKSDIRVVDAGEKNYTIKGGVVTFAVDSKIVDIPIDRWELICRDYSSYGGDMTQAQVSRRHGLPISIMRRVLSAYGHYKASPPASRERIAEHADDLTPLVEEAVENAEHRLLNRIEREGADRIKREHRTMKSLLSNEDRHTEAAIRIAGNITIPKVRKPKNRKGEKWTAMIPTTDEHFGLPVWGKAAFGENYDTDIAGERLIQHGHAGADWVRREGGHCEHIIRPYLGDFFHALTGRTEHGTPLDQDTRYEKVWDAGLTAVLSNLQSLREVADHTTLRFVPGNHDAADTFKFAKTIEFAIAAMSDVDVIVTPARYDATLVGETLHVFDHGYRVGSLSGWKAKAQAEIVAREIAPWEDYRQAKRIIVYVGHLHQHEEGSHGSHLQLVRLPALCETDDYATGLRYSSRAACRAFRLRPEGDRKREEWFTVSDLSQFTVEVEGGAT